MMEKRQHQTDTDSLSKEATSNSKGSGSTCRWDSLASPLLNFSSKNHFPNSQPDQFPLPHELRMDSGAIAHVKKCKGLKNAHDGQQSK